jgi:hypothetical protein
MNERPDIERIKAELAADIVRIVGELALTDEQAAGRLILAEGEFRHLRAGELGDFSIEWLVKLVNRLERSVIVQVSARAESGATSPGPLEAITRYAREAAAKIPPEELDRFPTDMAANLDHYLYGAPKQD